MTKTALITGVSGQDGSYLADLLLTKGYEVHGMVRRWTSELYPNIEHLRDDISLHQADLCDLASLIRLIQLTKPDEVYNLAAQSFVPTSFNETLLTGDITGLGVARVLEAIRIAAPEARFYQASSSEMYGKVAETPQTEATPFHPRSPYAVAKVYGHYLTQNYREAYGMHASSGILFNHESERRGLAFVTRKVTHAAAEIKLGLRERLHLGNLDARRDWGYAPDYVEAMYLMLQQDTPDDYVVATGTNNSVRDLVETAFSAVGLNWQDHVAVDQALVRPSEVDILLGSALKAEEALGWRPKVSFEQMIGRMVESDLAQLADKVQVSCAH